MSARIGKERRSEESEAICLLKRRGDNQQANAALRRKAMLAADYRRGTLHGGSKRESRETDFHEEAVHYN